MYLSLCEGGGGEDIREMYLSLCEGGGGGGKDIREMYNTFLVYLPHNNDIIVY
jgi:hypothetical protein